MPKKRQTFKLIVKILLGLLLVALLVLIYFLKISKNYPRQMTLDHTPGYFGVTFSRKFAEELGLNWRNAYLAVLDDLGVKNIRLPIYWDDIEREPGVYDFSDYDFMVSQGAKRDVKFILSVGYRLPRWPECHEPLFMRTKSGAEWQKAELAMLETVVRRYRYENSVVYWQVENEPLLNSFGLCPHSDIDFLQQEISLVRSLDDRPIIISASGELSSWKKEGQLGDIFGTTMYRVVWNNIFGYIHYPVPASFYRLKADLAGIDKTKRMIVELQAEPWVPHDNMKDFSPKEAVKSFDLDQFRANAQYAKNSGFTQAYLWGVEWWYFKKESGQSEYWDLAKELFK